MAWWPRVAAPHPAAGAWDHRHSQGWLESGEPRRSPSQAFWIGMHRKDNLEIRSKGQTTERQTNGFHALTKTFASMCRHHDRFPPGIEAFRAERCCPSVLQLMAYVED